MNKIKSVASFLVIISMFMGNALPAFAQLGDVTPPPVEAPAAPSAPAPAPEPAPAPVVELSAPPAPEATPEVEGVEPEVQTTVETGTQTVTETTTQIVASDTTAPVISGVADLSFGLSEATIVWTTDELATSRLEYGTTESYGSQATLDATALLAHTAIILGLSPNTTYYYCIHATDLSHNTRNSCGHSFRTSATQIIEDTTPPDVTLITVALITTTGATINFTTDQIGNTRVEYGTTAGYGETTTLNTTFADQSQRHPFQPYTEHVLSLPYHHERRDRQ